MRKWPPRGGLFEGNKMRWNSICGENDHHMIPFYRDPTAVNSNFIFETGIYDIDSDLD